MTKEITIKMSGINDAALLVEMAKKLSTDVTIRHGKFCVDGKSILGVLSLDMSDGVQVEYDENETEFENWLRKFEV
jgi:phosphocarrier protein HPr